MTAPQPKTLDQVCEFIVDCLHKTAPTQDSGYPLIRTPNIGKGRLNLENAYRVSEQVYQEWIRRATPEAADLILAREAPAGNVAIVKNGQQVCLGQRTVHLRPDRSQVDPDFLTYYLLAPKQQATLLSGQTGATAQHVNVRDIRRLAMKDLPTLEVQKRVGQLLSAYDDLIENNRRRIQLLEESVRLLYREWFVHLRFPGHEHVKVVDGVPEGWKPGVVPDAIELNPRESAPRTDRIKYVPMSALPEVGMNVSRSGIEVRDKSTNTKFRNQDVLLARITPCLENGKTGFVDFLDEGEVGCGSSEFIVLRAKRVSPMFAYCLARDRNFREKAKNSMVGSSGRQRVQLSALNDFPLPLPPKLLLDEFDEFCRPPFEQIRNLSEQNVRLNSARDLLLPRLMNGEIAV